MKTKYTLLILGLFLSIGIFAQAPEAINYQAVARDVTTGAPLVSTPLTSVVFEIRQGSSTGTIVYSETHSSVSTNQFGLFTAEIGNGIPSLGSFSAITWGSGIYYLTVNVNGNPLGGSQLLSVPYALYSKQSLNGPPGANGNDNLSVVTTEPAGANCVNGGSKVDVGVDDNADGTLQTLEIDYTYYVCNGVNGSANNSDTSATNELQTISVSNDTLFLSNGGFAVLPPALGDNWGTDVVNISGANISGDGTAGNPLIVIDNDTSATNELELPMIGNTLGDVLIWNGTNWVAGTDSVNDADNDPTNEIELPATATTGQILTWNGSAWIAQNAGSGADNWGSQVVVTDATLTGDGTAGNPLSGFDGNYNNLTNQPTIPTNVSQLTNDAGYITNPNDADSDPTNEIELPATASTNQVLTWNGSAWVAQTPTANTDNQDLSLTGNSLSLTNDATPVDLTPYMDNTDNQTLTYNSGTQNLAISGGNAVTLVVDDADNNPANEYNTSFTINGSNLEITDAGGTLQVPLTSIAPNDGDWTLNGIDLYNANTGNIGIGTTTPTNLLHISGNYTSVGMVGTFVDLQNTFGSSSSQAKVGIRFKTSNFPSGQHTKGGIIYSRTSTNGRGDIHFLNNSSDDISEIDYLTDLKMIIKNNGDVGIGTNAPFSLLDVNGQITMRTGSANGFIPVSDANGTMTWTDPATLALGSSWLYSGTDIYNGNAGNVGVGITTPDASKFHVVALNNGTAALKLGNTNQPTREWYFNVDGSGNMTLFNEGNGTPKALAHFDGSNGYVGINTTTPGSPLHVEGNTYINGVTAIGGSLFGLSATFKVYSGFGAGTAYFYDGSSNVSLSVLSSGDIVIGGTSGVGNLLIQDTDANTTGASGSHINIQNKSNTTNTTAGIRFRTGGTTAVNGDNNYKGAIFFEDGSGTQGEGDMIFAVNNVASTANVTTADAQMTLSRYGNISMGANINTNYKLYVSTSGDTYAGYFLTNNAGGSNYGIYANASSTAGSFNVGVYGRSSGAATTNYGLYGLASGASTTNWSLYCNGNAYSSSGTWTGSDEKLKTNIQSFEGAIEKLNQLEIKTYNFKTEEYKGLNFPDRKQYGLMAQNLEKVFPELVMETEHFIPDADGNLTEESITFKAVNYSQLIPVLVKAVQEQQQMIDELKKELEELRKK